jgi:hypothetical protein
MGSINRYMFDDYRSISSNTDTGETLDINRLSGLFEPILRMLPGLDEPQDDDSDTVTDRIEQTTIEIYNYIRHVNMQKVIRRLVTDGGDGSILPSDLRHIQKLLDSMLGKWKGRVILKNREDCPPCSACGFPGHWASYAKEE